MPDFQSGGGLAPAADPYADQRAAVGIGAAPASNAAPSAPPPSQDATVAIDMGQGRTAQARISGFLGMSADQQSHAVEDVKQTLSAQAPSASPPASQPDDTLSGAFTNGAKSAAHGLGETAKLATLLPSWLPGRQTVADAGQSLENAAGAPTPSVPAVGSAIAAAKSGNWGHAGYEALRAAAGAVPDIGGALAADVIPGGALAYLGARNLGDTADARAANNGHSAPTVGDALGALPSTAAQALIGRYGIGKAASGLPQGLRQLAQVGLEGGSAAAGDAAGQLGGSVGTASGTQLDPTEVAEAGLQGAAGRAVSLVPGAAGAVVKGATDDAMSRIGPQPANLDHAASIARVGQMFDQAQQAAQATKGDVSPLAAMNSVKTELFQNLQATVGGLRDVGLLEAPQARTLMATIRDQALRNNNTIAAGQGGAPTLFDRISALDLPDQVVQPILNGVRDLDTVSGQSFAKNQTGPFQQVGRFVGNYGGAAFELAHGSPVGAVAMLALGKTHAGAGVGGAVGAGVDRLLGTATPQMLLQRAAAQRMLGSDYQPSDTLGGLQAVQNAIAAQPQAAQFNGPEVTVQAPPDLTPAQRAAAGNAELLRQSRARAAAQANLDASAAAQDQANNQATTQASKATNSWLSGRTASPGDATDADTTADEIRGWQAFLANRATAAKIAAQQGAAYDKAGGSDLDSLAQAKLDTKARANEVLLRMAQKLPNEHPDVSDTAVDATVGQALAGAGRVLGNAGIGDPSGAALDRVSVGLPATDPVPVGGPQSPAGATAAPPLPPPPPATQPAQVDSAGLGAGTAQPPPAHTYAANRLMRDHGAVTSPTDFAAGLQAMVAGGALLPQQAALYQAGMPVLPAHGAALAQTIAAQKGLAPMRAALGGGVRDPQRWKLAAEAYHSHAEGLAQEADAVGLPGTGAAIRQTAQTYDPASGAATASLKTAVAQAHLDQIDHAGRRAAAARLFTQRLLNHGPRA